jgi:hypothetical protein
MKRLFALAALCAGVCLAQLRDIHDLAATPFFSTYRTASLSAAAEVVTIHAPTGPSSTGMKVYLVGASVYCSVACTVTLEQAGTAPTTTANAVVQLGQNANHVSAANAYHTSNVGAGTVISTLDLAAGETKGIDLTGITLPYIGATSNFTLRTSAITGTAKILIKWRQAAIL